MIKIINKIHLAIAIVLTVATTSVAQTVTVPTNCIVVSTNTALGGVLGAGGKVTSGGVVTMADGVTPNGGTFTFNAPVGSILSPIISWGLSGDLSNAANANTNPLTPAGNYGVVSQPANGTTATIISYNKFYRPSEGVAPSNASWARSKGRVTVGYSIVSGTFSCGSSLNFDIFKTFTATPITNVPVIVGPACVQAGIQCTFSVDQVASDNATDAIGSDMYYWSGLPATVINTPIYYSADYSSITFTPATSAPINLKCCIGRANPWDGGFTPILQPAQATTGTTCITRTIGAAPSQPVTSAAVGSPLLSTLFPLCVATGTVAVPNQSFTINYSSPNTCVWTMVNTGWTITSQTASSVTINTNGFNNPGFLTLTVSNGSCTPLTFQYQVNRSLTAPVAIAPTNTTLTTSCLSIGSTSNTTTGQNVFAISASASANVTSWSVTLPNVATVASGFSFTTLTPSSTVGLNVLGTASAGSYQLKATTSCGAILIYNFTVRPNAVAIVAPSPTCVTRGGSAVTFTCGTSAGATGYLWSFPSGWTATNFTTTTNSILVTPTSTAVAGGVTVTPLGAVNTCNGIASVAYNVNFNAVAPTGVTPPACFTAGSSSATLTVTNAQNFGTYTVTSNPVGITGTVTGSGVIPLIIPSTLAAGSYTLVVTHRNISTVAPTFNCGTASITTATLTLGANPYTIFTLLSAPSDTFFISGAPAGATYAWFVNNIAVATPPNPNQLVLTGSGAVPTSVFCNVTFNGCTTRMTASLAGVTHSQRMANGGTKSDDIDDVTIYPNPNSGNFNIKVANFKQEASAVLYDMNGRALDTFNLKIGENTIQKEGLSRGTYIISLTIDGKTTAQKVSIK